MDYPAGPLRMIEPSDPRLRLECDPVDGAPPLKFISRLSALMRRQNGIGIAAPQVGVLARLFVVNVPMPRGLPDPDGWHSGLPKQAVMINPSLSEFSTRTETKEEGCLSFRGIYRRVRRPVSVTVSYTRVDGSNNVIRCCGLLARCVQHEFDHLNGRVILDYGRGG